MKEEKKSYRPSLRVLELEKENRELLKVVEEQSKEIAGLKQMMIDLQMQIVTLQEMVFKKKRVKEKEEESEEDDDTPGGGVQRERKKRPRWSFRRAVPSEEEVTSVEEYRLECCVDCGSRGLEEIERRYRYIEDIPEVRKEVTKECISVYTCIDCGKEQSAISIPRGQQVVLGERVKSMILYLTYIMRCSHRDIVWYMETLYQLKISRSEIGYILKTAAQQFQPLYNGLKEELNKEESTNTDETGWPVGGEKEYLWGRSSPTSDIVILHAGNRGGGNAQEILSGFSGCVVTDCYAAYKNLDTILEGIEHQVCWVHILREAKEIALSPHLNEKQRASAEQFLAHLQELYQDLTDALDQRFNRTHRERQRKQFITRLRRINQLKPCDTSKKLKNIKLRTQEYEKELFTCLKYKTALPENNLAERNLRHIVLKRKQAFGSKSKNGARVFAINMSILLTFFRRFPNTFFSELQKALAD